MPHHRSLAPPVASSTRLSGRRVSSEPVIHDELRRHYDELYDRLLRGRAPREARPALDVGTGDGLTLAAIVQGTPLDGIAIDAGESGQWMGPAEWDIVRGDAHRLPFREGWFRSAVLLDVFEWLRHPSAALAEMGRVTQGPILLVQTDWDGLWVQGGNRADVAEWGREHVGAFTRGAPQNLRAVVRSAVDDAGLSMLELSMASIHTDRLAPGALAWDLLEMMRRHLVIESARVRARRFDEWRAALQRSAGEGQFELLLRRLVAVLE